MHFHGMANCCDRADLRKLAKNIGQLRFLRCKGKLER